MNDLNTAVPAAEGEEKPEEETDTDKPVEGAPVEETTPEQPL